MTEERTGRYYDLLQKLFKEIDQESIHADIEELRREKPEMSREQLAAHLTKRASMKVAGVGAAAGIPGGALGVLAMAPDIFNLVVQQSRLVLSIAFLYDRKPDIHERFREVLAVLALSAGASASSRGARVLIAKGLERAAAGKLARRIFGRALARKLPSAAPLLGTVAGGAINYFSMRAVGRAAVALYSGDAEKAEAVAAMAEPEPEAAPEPKPPRKRAPPKKSAAPAGPAPRPRKRSPKKSGE